MDLAHACNGIAKSSVTSAILHLVRLAEKRIADAMRNTKGTVKFDGWSAMRIHHIGVYRKAMTPLFLKQLYS